MLIAICLNALLATLVLGLAHKLWQWRCGLTHLTAWLEMAELARTGGQSPQQIGYAAALKRAQLIEMRLTLVRLKWLSVQIRQLSGLVKVLRIVLLYRAGPRLLRRKKHKNAVE
jgi:hypothetical protein